MGRKSKSVRLVVFLEQAEVGVLERSASGEIIFTYDKKWLEKPTQFPISYSLKLREQPYRGEIVSAYFDNFLPDSETIRKVIATHTGAASTGCIDLLAALGRDCVGALQFFQESQTPKFTNAIKAKKLSNKEVAIILRNLGRSPLGVSSSQEFRLSIAGAQEKTALLWHKNSWQMPLETTPTSHILKVRLGKLPSGIDLFTSIENEWFCLKAAEHLGLSVASASIGKFEDTDCLIVERFDRHWSVRGDFLKRLPQEDLCQALGIASSKKYETDGGPGVSQIMDFLDASDLRNKDRETFLRAQLVFFLLGATDGHGKNFSIYLQEGGFRLTPLYDILSVAYALKKRQLERKDVRLAMCVGDNKHNRLHEIQYRHWLQTAKQTGYPVPLFEQLLHTLAQRVKTLNTLLEILPEDFPEELAEAVVNFATQQMKKLEGSYKIS